MYERLGESVAEKVHLFADEMILLLSENYRMGTKDHGEVAQQVIQMLAVSDPYVKYVNK